MERFFGKYRAILIDAADAAGRGRVKVVVPSVSGDMPVWADWAPAYQPGSLTPPALRAGTRLVIEYLEGDPDHPIWTGHFLPEVTDIAPAVRDEPTVPAGFEIGLGTDGALGTLYLQELTFDLGNRRLTINARDQAAISGSADGVSPPISVALELEQPDPADDGRRRHIQEVSITASCTLVLRDSGLPGIFVIKPPGG